MSWNSSADFFAMGGYAFYVWGSFGSCALLMLTEPWLILKRRQAALSQMRSEHEAGLGCLSHAHSHVQAGLAPKKNSTQARVSHEA